MIGAGLVQAWDAVAMDTYLAWRQFDMDDTHSDKVNTFMAGARVKF